MEKFQTGKMTEKGQVVIPANLRRKLELKEGDRLEFELDAEGNIFVRPIKKRSVLESYGVFKTDKPAPDLEDIRSQVRKDMISEKLLNQGQGE